MRFVTGEMRMQATRASQTKKTQKELRLKSEVMTFCQPYNIKRVVLAVQEEVRQKYLAQCGDPLSSVLCESGAHELGGLITDEVTNSEECSNVLLNALQEVEPSVESVTINIGRNFNAFVVVTFNPPLT